MKNLCLLIIGLLTVLTLGSCKDDETKEEKEVYSYASVNVDARFSAKVIWGEKVVIYIDNSEENLEAKEVVRKETGWGIIFQATYIWFSAKEWPVSLQNGDNIKFKLTGYGIQQNYKEPVLDLPPVRFYVEPILGEE